MRKLCVNMRKPRKAAEFTQGLRSLVEIEETLDRQDATACKVSDKRRKETCEGSKGDGS